MSRKGSVYRKKGKINEYFVPLRYSMLKGPLVSEGYLKPIDIFFYSMIAAQTTGDENIDKALTFTNERAKKFASVSTFSQSKFRLWAFRTLEVTRWGRKTKQPTTFKISLKWKTLIRMPTKLERIQTLVRRHERVMNFRPKTPPKRAKIERQKKRQHLYMGIRKKLIEVPL